MLQALERYLKQAIVDKLPHVSSAALVRAYHLTSGSGELVKRWVSEVQEALNSDKYAIIELHKINISKTFNLFILIVYLFVFSALWSSITLWEFCTTSGKWIDLL